MASHFSFTVRSTLDEMLSLLTTNSLAQKNLAQFARFASTPGHKFLKRKQRALSKFEERRRCIRKEPGRAAAQEFEAKRQSMLEVLAGIKAPTHEQALQLLENMILQLPEAIHGFSRDDIAAIALLFGGAEIILIPFSKMPPMERRVWP